MKFGQCTLNLTYGTWNQYAEWYATKWLMYLRGLVDLGLKFKMNLERVVPKGRF